MSRRPGKALIVATVLVASLCASEAATAQAGDVRQRADAAYKQGVGLAKAGKTEAALAKFEESRAIFPTPRALFQVAKAEQLLGQHDLALLHYRQALRDESLPDASRQEAAAAIEDLKTKVGMISLDVPAGATVTVDGNPIVDPKALIEVAPGTHRVKVTLGDDSRVTTATCEPGKAAVVRVRFDGDPPTSAPPPPATSLAPAPPPLHDPGFWTTGHVVGVGLASLAVLGAGLGVGLLVARGGQISDQESLAANPLVCADTGSAGCRAFDDAGATASSLGTAAAISFVAAGLAGAGAAVLLWPGGARAPAAAARLIVHGQGVVLAGAF